MSSLLKPIGAHTSTALGAGVLTVNTAGAGQALVQAIGQNIRLTLDGTAPTASSGFQVRASDPPTLINIYAGVTLKFIREASGATLEYQLLG